MYANRYYVDRESGTYSDSCAAFGLAYLLSRALIDSGVPSQVTVKDLGTTYLLELATSMTPEIVAISCYPDELLPIIQNETHPEGATHYSLDEQWTLLRSKTAKAAGQIDAEQSAQLEMRDDFNMFALIEQLQGDGLLNRLAKRLWKYRHHYPGLLSIVLSVYAETPNRSNEGRNAFTIWKKTNKASDFEVDDSLLAIFSPTWQKSVNRVKADSAKNENCHGFWIPEYLKMIGMPRCALVVSVRSGKSNTGDEDKKIYAVAPSLISLDTHASVMKAFSKNIYRSTSIKSDITILLNYSEALLIYIQRSDQRQRSIRKPVVDGFYSAYFKKSSRQRSGLSLTNLPFLQLPTWIRFRKIPTNEEIALYQSIIEHQRAVLFFRYNDAGEFEDFIDENKGEGYELLRGYREFLTGGSFTDLFEFFARFSSHVMQQAAQKKSYRQFDLSQIRRLLLAVSSSLQEILDDDGFREVARAIRLCTVTAQRLKAKDIRTQHEIRYGLAQEFKRKAPFKQDFTAAIMAFINQYQTENARYRDRGGSNIHEITTSHVRNLAVLIDACPGTSAEPIASLLLAFGYAYDDDPKEEQLAKDISLEVIK